MSTWLSCGHFLGTPIPGKCSGVATGESTGYSRATNILEFGHECHAAVHYALDGSGRIGHFGRRTFKLGSTFLF
jgi:hypothetical protein